MCNIGVLYFYELKKILQKKMVWITFGIIFFFVVFMSVGDILFLNYEEDGQKISAYEKMISDRDNARALSGREINDELLNEMRQEGTKKYDAIYQIAKHLKNDDEEAVNLDETELYQTRAGDISSFFYDQKLTEGEIAYWQEKEAGIKKPFTYEYTGGYAHCIDLLYNMHVFMVMMIAVSLAGVFADEHLRKTDQLVLGSRYGKKILYFAKLGAGVSVGLGSIGILLFTGAVISLAVYGMDGFYGAIQLIIMQSSWHLSVGETCFCLTALLFILAVFYSIVTMFLSEGFRSSAATMAVILGMFFVTFFFNLPYQYRIPSQILGLMPAKIMRANGWADLRLVRIFGTYLMSYQFAPLLYIAVMIILILLGKRMYERFQVGGR